MKPIVKTIQNQPSFIISSDSVELAITRLGAHMAPVTFFSNSNNPVQPYYVSPWQKEKTAIGEPVLRPLRGDFFCMPFGGNNELGSERHVAHGEPATAAWDVAASERTGSITSLTLKMTTNARPGRINRHFMLKDGQQVVYDRSILEGYSGPMCLGHHATLEVGSEEDSLRFSSSPIRFGYTSPRAPGPHAKGEYFCLPPGARFKSLARVPTIWKDRPSTDRSTFPAEEGFTDILAIFPKSKMSIAWNAAVYPRDGFVWFALRDPSLLNSTVLWMANRGRHGEPWNGRNRCLGIEDVCAYFAEGLSSSARKNMLNQQGIPTALKLNPTKPTFINYIQGVARIPKTFDRVRTMEFKANSVRMTACSGAQISAEVDTSFISSGKLL